MSDFDDENNVHSSSSDEHHLNEEEDHDSLHQPSAPPTSDDNGYIVVQDAHQHHSDKEPLHESLNKDFADISSSVDASLSKLTQKVLAEADSSTSARETPVVAPVSTPDKSEKSSECSICPYYALGCNYLSNVQIPPKVRDLLLWSDPKYTGAVFGSSFVLLLSLASFSLLTVVSSLFLLAITAIGAYRFYLAAVFRIKGVEDKTFEKLSSINVSLPKNKIQELAKLLDNDANRVLNQLKSILLWDSIATSSIAFIGFYVVYCIGCIFNTLTLLILTLVSLFTLPKVYEVYKVQIDQGLEKATSVCHGLVKQVLKKVPFLSKKKTQ